MNKTRIEWAKNPDGSQGYTWNPTTGCLNGCAYCYARKLANGRLRSLYQHNTNVVFREGLPTPDYSNPFYPRFWENRLYEPSYIRKPSGIFVVDMGDLFGDWIPEEWQRRIFQIFNDNRQHRFYLLTKQPQNLVKWSPFPDNCFVGVTATNAKMVEEAGFWLWEVEAKVKFVSFEPLLERLPVYFVDCIDDRRGINWVIIGAQTNPYNPPKLEWVEEIVEACDKAGIPVFLKENLRRAIPISWFTGEPLSNPNLYKDGKLRQEMPGEASL